MDTSRPGLAAGREQQLVAAFVELANTLIEDFDLVEFVAGFTKRVVGIGIATQACVQLADATGSLRFVASSDGQTQLLELFETRSHAGPGKECFRTGAPVAVARLEDELERWPVFAPKALAAGFGSAHALPLRHRDTVLGALCLFHDEPGRTDPANLAVAQAMADVATIGLLQRRELHRAHSVEAQLQHALHSRVTIEQSKGIICEQTSLPMTGAYHLLRAYSRDNNLKLSDTARRIVEGTLDAKDLAARR